MERGWTGNSLSRRELMRAGAVLGLGVALGGCAVDGSDREVSDAALRPRRRGGVLRVGITGGGTSDTIEPHAPVTYPDDARVASLYEPLFRRDPVYQIEPVLAESIEPSDHGRTWTLRLRDGVEFHNGKRLDIDDVVFTLQRLNSTGRGTSALRLVDLAGLRPLDRRTLRIPLTQPYALFQDELAQYARGVLPVGFDLAHPVGTGPFRFGSFTPGGRSAFPRFENYWRTGEPYVDELVMIDFPDPRARVNALLSGDVDAIDNVPRGLIPTVKAGGAIVLVSETGQWTPLTMRVDAPPFDDARVRQAFRLIVDRDQMVREVLAGQGRVANDLYAPFDTCYAKDLPQRRQDLDQARSLLRQAGRADLQTELVTSAAIGTGAVDAARLFAWQARGAGVDIRVREVDGGAFYGESYLNWVFAQDYWFTRSYLPQVAFSSVPGAVFNECHWNDPEFTALIEQARAELDQNARDELLKRAQALEYDRGGYLIWGFQNQVDAYSAKVTGFVPDRNLPLSSFQFRLVSFV
jgi:peptide/nickel transport system substrate-binding protein